MYGLLKRRSLFVLLWQTQRGAGFVVAVPVPTTLGQEFTDMCAMTHSKLNF